MVVLPAPFGPIKPVIVPSGAARLTLSSAIAPPKRTEMSVTTRPSRDPAVCPSAREGP